MAIKPEGENEHETPDQIRSMLFRTMIIVTLACGVIGLVSIAANLAANRLYASGDAQAGLLVTITTAVLIVTVLVLLAAFFLIRKLAAGALREKISQASASRKILESTEKRLLTAKKETANAKNRANELESELKQLNQEDHKAQAAVLNVLDDISEAKKTLEREKNKLETILNGIRESVVVIDKEGVISFMNLAAVSLLELDNDNAPGTKLSETLKIVNEIDNRDITNLLSEPLTLSKTATLPENSSAVTKNGTRIPVKATLSPFHDSEGDIAGVIIVMHDVAQERTTNRLKTEFISHASHELRTPITSIRWMMEMLMENVKGTATSEQAGQIKNIYDLVIRMNDTIHSLLKVSRIDSNSIALTPKKVNLKNAIQETLTEQKPVWTNKEQNVTVSATDDASVIETDRALLDEILSNLLSNAIKYTDKKGEIGISASSDGDYLILRVTDNGIGIPESERDGIFSKFFRASNAKKMTTEGDGLGLYIVKQLMDMSGGEITFEPTDSGTAFTVRLPKKMKEVVPSDPKRMFSLKMK